MGEKGNVADVERAAGATKHNVVTDTVSSGLDVATGIATGTVTGVATGVTKDKIDERIKPGDEPTH